MNNAERQRERLQAECELSWARPQVSFAMLDHAQVLRVRRWVRTQIRNGPVHVPGTSYVRKERRLGRTNRLGWRWVVYVEALGSAREASTHMRRKDANEQRRHHHARWWANAIQHGKLVEAAPRQGRGA